jgi:periplasmic protein TonB
MVHPFVSSPGARGIPLGVPVLSVLAHASLIALALTGGTAKPVREVRGESVEHVVLPPPVVRERLTERTSGHRPAKRAARARSTRSPLERLSQLHLTLAIATDLPPSFGLDIDFATLATEAIDFGDAATSSLARTVLGPADAVRMIGDAYSDWVVEKVAAARDGNPIPKYPERLRRNGVEGDLLVQFVVDSTGRVDARDIRFPASAHALFAESVRRALLKSRYLPAELGGHRVRQHVRQQFIFRIVR